MSWFVEYTCDGNQVRIELQDGGVLKIGRGSTSDTKIPDSALSRLHCELSLSNGVPVVRDLGSSAGTYYGREKISEQILASGESFQAGNTTFAVVSDSPMDAPTDFNADSHQPTELDSLVDRLEDRKTLDRFRLEELVNRGGRNLVYRGTDPETNETIAIKVLPTTESSDEDEARFMRAMKMLLEIRDPCLVRLIRAGRKKRYCWVAMEWFAAGSVRDRIDQFGVNGCLDWKNAWRIALCISQSLHVLEKAGAVHRNIRPANILYRSADDTWVLSDLVVAKTEDLSSDTPMVTQQVFLPHDLSYTAPERLLGRESNAHSLQADLYSLGAVLTEVLTGEPPLGRGDLRDLLQRLNGPRKSVSTNSQIGLNELFVDLVNRLTEPDPERRFSSAAELWQNIDRVGQLAGMGG